MKGLDLRGFKKVRTEGGYTTLRHPKGHEIKVAHYALDKKTREAVHALPAHETEETLNFSDGGQASPSPTPAAPPIDKDKAKQVQDSFKNALGFAEGGQVDNDADDSANRQANRRMVNGESDAQRTQRINQANAQPTRAQQVMVYGGASGTQYAQGGPVTDPRHHLAEATLHLARSLSTPQVPHYADGSGPIQVPQGSISLDDAQSALSNNFPDTQATPGQPEQSVNTSQGVPTPVTPPSQTPTQHSGGDLVSQALGDVATQNAAEMASARNTAHAADQMSNIYGDQSKHMEAIRNHFEEVGNDLHQKFADTADQVEQGHIDPTHWWSQKSTGSKILTAIGMMFAGAGAGVSGHPELASKSINEAIERDIDAQKANLSNKNNLLSKYMEMYNSLPQAEAAARLTMGAGVEGLINQQAAKLNSANAVNTATQSNAARRQALLPQLENLAKSQAVMNYFKTPDQTNDPAHQIRRLGMMGMMSPEQQTAAEKELGSSQRIAKLQEDVEQSARDLNTRLFAGKLTPSLRNSQLNTFAGILAKEAEGRFNLEEAKQQMSALMPSPLDNKATVQKKSENRRKFFESMKVTPTLQTYGINPTGSAQTQAPGVTYMNGKPYRLDPSGRFMIPVK